MGALKLFIDAPLDNGLFTVDPDFWSMIGELADNGGTRMSSCCYDPTEPHKIDPRELIREQERYGNLVRDLFTGDPEKIMLRLLLEEKAYLRELAALRARYPSVRLRAIELLEKPSLSVLEKIGKAEPDTPFGLAAQKRIEQLQNGAGLKQAGR